MNMKSSCNKEDTARKNASYHKPSTNECLKTSVGANQYTQPWQQQRKESSRIEVPIDKSNKTSLKTLDNILHHSIPPCPFTILTAVKRKIALDKTHSNTRKTYESEEVGEMFNDTMEFIKPLKVPDLKISSKTDYSSRESLLSSEELSKKIEASHRDEKTLKNNDRPSRKLEFSSSNASSIFNYENIEPLKIPDISISKKKDLSRDNSREKENRTKKVKRDNSNNMQNNSDFQELSKWAKSQRHISRREIADAIISRKLKNDHILAHGPRENEALKKSKPKNVITSTARKDEVKRHKCSSILSNQPRKERSLDSKNRTSSSDSLCPLDKGTRLHEKILIREGYKAMISDVNDRKYKDDSYIGTKKLSEDQKHKSHSETRLQKAKITIKPIDLLTRDQKKSDKQKSSKHSSEISEDLTTAATSLVSQVKSLSTAVEKIPDKTSQSSSSRNKEDSAYSDVLSHRTSDPVLNSSIIDTNISQNVSISEKLMDPMRISFRDNSYSNQPEFDDLITPDVNLVIRTKRRKFFQVKENDDDDYKNLKHSDSPDTDEIRKMQSKDINLLDVFSESLSEVVNTEKSRQSSDDVKRQSVSLQSDNKNSDSIKTELDPELKSEENKIQKQLIKVAEVQTQTVNDIATQTETTLVQRGVNTSLRYSRGPFDLNEDLHLSLNSEEKYEDTDQVGNISLQNRMRSMSEISLYETTSSIKTETGTEISISTRDVTCSFNKHLDLEMAQLIKDERQRYDKIEMLFKSHEKTLNDRTKKLVKLEEQKRALRDTGQDDRISSVKKKQRALLLKLQQEKDEMNRLKELHKIASQERKLMLQKQRDMFNPDMSTRNILNKLKRSADNQSPRRLSGPMKGYDIRSNSSRSSLVDSDKSQLDRSQLDFKLNLSDITSQKNDQPCSRLELDCSLKQGSYANDNAEKKLSKLESNKQKESAKNELKNRKFEEKMPKVDLLNFKAHQRDLDAILRHGATAIDLLRRENQSNLSADEDDKSLSENAKSESNALIEEFSQIWKSQFPDLHSESFTLNKASDALEAVKELQKASNAKRFEKQSPKKSQQQSILDNKITKRKGAKSQKSKLELGTKVDDSHYLDDAFRYNKRTKVENDQHSDNNIYENSMLDELDFNESQSSLQALLKHSSILKERNDQLLRDIVDEHKNPADNSESPLSQKDEETPRGDKTSSRSQVSLTISHQSSNDSDRSYSRSVVIRSQQDHHHSHSGFKTSKKLEQILRAREATLASRRNCVQDWMAWHARLREEENRVARMEQAAYKLVTATAKALSHNDTTVSSDTSDVEGRIEQLTQKLADRRLEMARLKKEARKQAKQRLRALEANLLNQIKKYDATINEMRKKLEAKKLSSKEIDKLAIESKSVIDFKVPEIPIKKIQEIYKSSDLLRSKSDSDIITDITSKSEKTKSNDAEKDSSRSKSSDSSKPSSALYTVYDEEHESSEKSDYSAVHSNKTKSNSEEIPTQRSVYTDLQDLKRPSSQSSNISEELPSEAHSIKSQSEQIHTMISDIKSIKDLKESTNIEEELALVSDDTSIVFSKKLDHIQLHNKELNEDIRNLENDLKELTEMVSNFSKKSDDKNVKTTELPQKSSKDSEKSTSKEISENILVSELIHQNDIDEDLQNRVKKILSDVIPETDDLVTSIEELDVKSKTKDELSESEVLENCNKSSISKEISTYMSSHNNVKVDLSGTNLYDDQLHSITEVISTYVEDVEELEEEKKSIALKETENSASKVFESLDNVISQIETEYQSEYEKIDSTAQVLEIFAEDVESLRESDEVPDEQIILSKYAVNEIIDDQMHSTAENRQIETKILNDEEMSVDQVISLKESEKESVRDEVKNKIEDEHIENEITADEEVRNVSLKENTVTDDPFNKTTETDNNWTLSDSFEIQQISDKDSKSINLHLERIASDLKYNRDEDRNIISVMDDSALFIPKGESTNIQDTFVLKLDESSDPRIGIQSDEFKDILEIIERETKIEDDLRPEPAVLIMSEEPNMDIKTDDPIECGISFTIKTVDDESESIEEELESKNDVSISEGSSESEVHDLPQIEIDVKIQLVDEYKKYTVQDEEQSQQFEDKLNAEKAAESTADSRASSDAEEKNNLIEVAEGKLDTLEKLTPKKEKEDEIPATKPKTHVTVFLDKTFEVIKDPGYEDISEESLDISESLDKSDSRMKSKKFAAIPEKYIIKSKSDEVLRILDELSNKSSTTFKEERLEVNNRISQVKSPEILPAKEEIAPSSPLETKSLESVPEKKHIEAPPTPVEVNEVEHLELKSKDESTEKIAENNRSDIPEEIQSEDTQEKENSIKDDSESSGCLDTPRGVSEIEMDSPREVNEDSRLDIDALDDDLLSGNSLLAPAPENEAKTEFRTTPMGVASEKDIQAMIDKLKATLGQPGLEVAELEATLLQIENLQIELAIKKLEAEEVSYYYREIPNKPPPPYTAPGTGRLSSTHSSPSPPPAVIPSNADELTAITEKATSIIFQAKQAGDDILSLEAPAEFCEIAKDNNDTLKKDRRIYNTFLFDLCKELVAEVYRTEQESPGPSWTKPKVKTNPVVKVPKNLDELNEYVTKEAATLFGFKSKLQRENMVMRWSRKRRDRVDELLAKEAQSEEKEWTKFHHDELAVKNELTITILDTIITETTNCIKAAYAKKRKVSVR